MKPGRTTSAFVVFAATAALFACSGSDEPDAIKTGSIPTPTDKVAVAAPEPGGFTPFDKWPKACALLTEADLRAALPGITKLEQKSVSYQLDVSDGAFGRPVRETIVDGTCTYRFWFDGEEESESADARSNLMNVSVRLAGDPKIVGLNYKPGDLGSSPNPKVPGAEECRLSTSDIECKLPNVSFVVNQGITLFGGVRFDKQPDGQSSADYLENELLPAFAQVVATRLS